MAPRVDKNWPGEYRGADYLEEDDPKYINNITTELHHKPRNFPFKDAWEKLKGSSYHKTTWVPADNVRDEILSKRRLERDPNHPKWNPRYGLLQWWHIKISLLGSDSEGRQHIMIRKGQAEPIFLRVGRLIEVFYKGKKVDLG